jgi:hypothetical protein
MSSVTLKRICVRSIEIQGSSASIPTSLLAGRPRDPSSVRLLAGRPRDPRSVLGRGFFFYYRVSRPAVESMKLLFNGYRE